MLLGRSVESTVAGVGRQHFDQRSFDISPENRGDVPATGSLAVGCTGTLEQHSAPRGDGRHRRRCPALFGALLAQRRLCIKAAPFGQRQTRQAVRHD